MAQYDGTIRINTKIDTGGARESLESLEYAIRGTAKELASLHSKMAAMRGKEFESDEYKKLKGDLSDAEKELSRLVAKQDEWEKIGATSGSMWDTLNEQIATASDRVDSIKEKIQQLKDSGKDTILGEDTVQYKTMERQVQYEEKALAGYREQYRNMLGGVEGQFSRISQAAQRSFSAVASSFSKMGGIARKAFSGMAGMAKKAFSAIASGTKKSDVSLSSAIKTFLKYSLGIRSLYVLVNRIRAAIKEGFNNLAQVSAPVNASLSELKSSLTQLKNSLATAFAPILTAATPMLSSLINMLSRAATYAGMLTAALTGARTFTKAIAVQQDYAASLDRTAGAAKKALGALAGFDRLNVLSQNKDDSGGGAAGEINPKDMFEEVPIEDKFKDTADQLKKMWEGSDFVELGQSIGEWLKNALDNIDWGRIKETAARIGKSLATLLNGFVEVDGLADSIGRTIGEAINTGIIGINAFLDNTHWDSVGKFIGNALNGIVNTVDWAGLGHLFAQKWNAIFETVGYAATTFDWSKFGASLAESVNTFITDFSWEENGAHLGELVKGMLDTIVVFLEETNWQELGEKCADFVGAIDWNGITDRLFEGIGAVLGGLSAFLWGLIKDAWDKVVKWWKDAAYEDGEFTIEGLLEGIAGAVVDIGKWIYEHIFKPFIDGFKKAFGIASPSKVMKEQGEFIMQGLLDGITSLVDSVTETWESMKEKAVEIWEAVKEELSATWDSVKEKATEVWEDLKRFFTDTWGDIQGVFEGITEFLLGTFTGDWQLAWDGIVQIFDGVWSAMKGIINSILGGVEMMANGVVDAINTMIRALNNFKVDFPDWVPLAGGKTMGNAHLNSLLRKIILFL